MTQRLGDATIYDMPNADRTPIVAKPWAELTRDEFYDIVRLRAEVFIRGQRIVDEPEIDEVDRAPSTIHVWVPGGEGALAYLRVTGTTPDDADMPHITRAFGRVAVHPSARGTGLAQRLVEWVIDTHGDEPILIHAQAYIAALYEKYGFERIGELYEEAGIPHWRMVRNA